MTSRSLRAPNPCQIFRSIDSVIDSTGPSTVAIVKRPSFHLCRQQRGVGAVEAIAEVPGYDGRSFNSSENVLAIGCQTFMRAFGAEVTECFRTLGALIKQALGQRRGTL